jgi:uncharacterized integral membrane protein
VSEPGQEEQRREEERFEEESRFGRGVRYGRRTSLYLAIVLGIGAIVLLVLLIARNSDRVDFDYVFGNAQTRLIWLIVISAICGWVLGIVTAYFVRRRTRWRGQR